MQVWAIDSADTTEVDDAISIEMADDGCHRYWVHVADPTRWLAMGTALEQEAARRTSTLYLPTGEPVPYSHDHHLFLIVIFFALLAKHTYMSL